MAFPQGIYFRATDNQTDPTNYDAEVGTTANYPRQSAQGNDVGWETAPGGSTRDRTADVDVRLRGIVFVANVSTLDYRIDLPAAGDYNIRLAMGDRDSGQDSRIRLLDDATVFADIDPSTIPANQWYDATGVLRTSSADWVDNNAVVARTFTSTIFRIRVGGKAGGAGNSVIAAVYIEAVGGGLTAGAESAYLPGGLQPQTSPLTISKW